MLTESQQAALALLRSRRRQQQAAGQLVRRPAGPAELPLSYGQEQLWFIDRFAPGQPTYNVPLPIGLTGPLDATALGRALDGVVARHEVLRTRLVTGSGGRPGQVIDPPGPVRLGVADLSGLPPPDRRTRLVEFIDREAMGLFALATDRLLRACLVRLADAEHVLLVVLHHAVFDGWSAGLLVNELAALYRQDTGARTWLACLPSSSPLTGHGRCSRTSPAGSCSAGLALTCCTAYGS